MQIYCAWLFLSCMLLSGFGGVVPATKKRQRSSMNSKSRPRRTGYREFGSEMNKINLRRARDLLQSGKCEHVYLDLGTNVGIQIRKLYEPSKYPKAALTNFFKDTFSCSDDCHNVCAFGFEANPKWTPRLKEIDDAYNSVNYNVIMFTETAVSNYTGNITFYMDYTADKKFHEWGSSTLPWQKEMNKAGAQKVTVGALDIATFLSREVYSRNGQTEASKVVMKMDIEGSEWYMVPYLLQNGVLCGIDNIFLELHQWIVKRVPKVKEFESALQWILSATPNCKTHMMNLDDESYGYGEDTKPLPGS